LPYLNPNDTEKDNPMEIFSETIIAKLPLGTRAAVETVCARSGMRPSDFVRLALARSLALAGADVPAVLQHVAERAERQTRELEPA